MDCYRSALAMYAHYYNLYKFTGNEGYLFMANEYKKQIPR